MVKNPPANEGDTRGTGSILGWGRSPEEEMATHSSLLAWIGTCRHPKSNIRYTLKRSNK